VLRPLFGVAGPHEVGHAAAVAVDRYDIVLVFELFGKQSCVREGLAGLVVFDALCAVVGGVGRDDSVVHAASRCSLGARSLAMWLPLWAGVDFHYGPAWIVNRMADDLAAVSALRRLCA
jgi:hypothetical protein